LVNTADHGDAKLNLKLADNPYNCDCKDYGILLFSRVFRYSRWLDGTNCDEPPEWPEMFTKKVGPVLYKL